MQRLFPILLLTTLLGSQCMFESSSTTSAADDQITATSVWIGTYTRTEGHVDGKAAGIYHYRLQDSTWQQLYTQSDIPNPSFLAVSPNQRFLYAVSETGPDVDTTGYVYAYAIQGDSLRYLNRQPTYSFAPCQLSVAPDGRQLFLTNYVGGMIVRYPLTTDGRLTDAGAPLQLTGKGSHPRQESSHPHAATISPDGKWVMITDLGTDLISTFAAGGSTWTPGPSIPLPAGAGPRHLAFHPTSPFAYSINELNSTVTAFHYSPENGALHIIAHYPTLPTDFEGDNLTADIHLTPDGQYLYASNRGHNSLAGFRIDPQQGTLTAIGHTPTQGDFPRNFAVHPSGEQLWVANQNTDNILVLDLDLHTGQLSPKQLLTVPTPVCLQWSE